MTIKVKLGIYNLKVITKEFIAILQLNKMTKIGFCIFTFILLLAVLADYIAPYNPYERVGPPLSPPSMKYMLGTNDIGQDILSELIYGARTSLLIGFTAAIVGTIIGVLIGLASGYFGGIVDEVLMRLTDAWLSIPTLLFTIFLVALTSRITLFPTIYSIIIAISLTSWPGTARLVRSRVLSIKESPYIESAIAIGASSTRIMFKHILPNVIPIIVVTIIMTTARAILVEASLGFLGLGDPTVKSWGMMIHYAMKRNAIILGMWWWFIPPGILISLLILSIYLIGIGLEEYYNPRLRHI